MSDRFEELRVFVRVAETGSFSRAGRELGYAQPSVSRVVSALEARLGVRLLLRTTRKVAVTQAGAALLERARVALAELDEAERAARGAGGLSGTLRVATPVTFGAREIVPHLPGFLQAHPGLHVELLMADRRVDLLDEGVDLAIRLGPLDNSAFTARTLASAPRFLLASPAYLARAGTPDAPEAVAGHALVGSHTGETWTFTNADGQRTTVAVKGRIVANAVEGLLAAGLAGMGLVVMSGFACRAELARGDLQRVLPGWALPPVEVHAVTPAGRLAPARARLFGDYLAAALGAAAARQ